MKLLKMKRIRALKLSPILPAFFLVAGMMLLGTNARASQSDFLTKVTINQAIEIPGHKILPAGSYWFKVADTDEAPSTLEIWNANRSRVEAIVDTIPTTRAVRTDALQLTLADQGRNHPYTLVKWFYPGRFTGQEFVFSGRTERLLNSETAINVFGGGFGG